MLSHRLLIRSGYISQLGAGIFSFTPIGWRVIEKIKNIITNLDEYLEFINNSL